MKHLIGGLSSLILLSIDICSKWYVDSTIPLLHLSSPIYPYGGIPLFKDVAGMSFSINHVTNQGAAFGLFSSFPKGLLIFRIGVIAFLFAYLLRHRYGHYFAPLLLILTGAIGNVVDEWIYGHVVDMFHFTFAGHSYPLFNVADSSIFCGVLWLFCLSFKESKRKVVG